MTTTKAELERQVEDARAAAAAAQAAMEAAKQRAADAAQSRDLEANAINICAQALDDLRRQIDGRTRDRASSYGVQMSSVMYARDYQTPLPPEGRVLEYLWRRYNLPDRNGATDQIRRELAAVTEERDRLRQQLERVRDSFSSAPVSDMGYLS